MIDTNVEDLIALDEVPNLVPRIVGRDPIDRATVALWARRGVQGVKLEVVCIGGLAATSREAVARFLDRTTQVRFGDGRQPRPQRGGRKPKAPRGRDRKAAADRKRTAV